MNRLLYLSGIALIGLAAFGMSSTARAQALPVDVDITIEAGGIAILNYYESINVTVDPVDLATLHGLSDYCLPTAGEANCTKGASPLGNADPGPGLANTGAAAADLHADGGLTIAAPAANLRNVRLDLDNIWAVRATGGLTNSTIVTILPGTATVLTNDTTTSTIGILNVEAYSMDGGSIGPTVSFADPGLTAPHFGGARLYLDMSNALTAGVYSTTLGGETDANFTIEITGT
jgi:hypothetical protein